MSGFHPLTAWYNNETIFMLHSSTSPASAMPAQQVGYRFREVHLELTTACNFRCGFCPLVELRRPQARMDFKLAQSVLRQCIDDRLCDHATFHLMGEALLHPYCVEVMEYCKQLGISTRLVTNGSLYQEEKYIRLFRSLQTLDISYRTVDDMELQSVQKKLTYEQYLDRVLTAIRLRSTLSDSSTAIRIRVFISEKTISSLVRLCDALGIDSKVITASTTREVRPYSAFNPYPWLTFLCEKEFDWRDQNKPYPSRFANCDEFDTGFAVLASGDVTTCCWDAHGGNVVGNVGKRPIMEILFGETASSYRRAFANHRMPTETCQRCLGRPTLARSLVYQALSLINIRQG